MTEDERNELARAGIEVTLPIAEWMTRNQSSRLEIAQEAGAKAVSWCLDQYKDGDDWQKLVERAARRFIKNALTNATKNKLAKKTKQFPNGPTKKNPDADEWQPAALPVVDTDFLLDLADMPDEIRRPVELYLEGRSLTEVGTILGISRHTVQARIKEVLERFS